MGRRAKPAKAKVEGKQLPGGKPPKADDARVHELEKRLAESLKREAEALEQQTATAEILRVISSSPTDVQPVFDTIVRNGVRLSRALISLVTLYDGSLVHIAASHHPTPTAQLPFYRLYPRPVARTGLIGQAIVERTVYQVTDTERDPRLSPVNVEIARSTGYRSFLIVPMLREERAIGAVLVGRPEPSLFSDGEIALLQTFADQAVIAIENVRLFRELEARNNELRSSLEQQTATSELLKVIGRSTFDLQPVFDALAENVVRFCRAERAFIFRVDGQLLRGVASYNASPEIIAFLEQNPATPGRGSATGRAALERRTVHIHDALADPEYTYGSRDVEGFRTIVGIPVLKAGELLGVITINRHDVRPFSDSQIALMETFADQAAIAIENVRLFTELQEKNRALTEAHAQVTETLEQQTATGEILRVISSSPTDVRPVFNTIARSAVRLCTALFSSVYSFDGEFMRLVAHHNFSPDALTAIQTLYPARPGRETAGGRAILDQTVIEVEDVLQDAEYGKNLASIGGWRSAIAVPMLHRGGPVGAIAVAWAEPGRVSESHIQLLKTFADQAVIAIENVRLFGELEARNGELTTALERQTATSEVLRVISGAQQDAQAVFDTIVQSAVRLCRATTAAVFRVEDGVVYHPANYGGDPEALAAARARYPRSVDMQTMPGMIVLARSIVQIPDSEEVGLPDHVRQVGRILGFRSVVGVPMLREGEAVGALLVTRRETGRFSDPEVELLKTFSDQAVIAIENVRLFKELEARNRTLAEALEQQTATAEILRVMSTSPTDLQPVLDTVVSSAARFCGAYDASLFQLDGEVLKITAHHGPIPNPAGLVVQVMRGFVLGRAVLNRQPVQVSDIQTQDEAFPESSALAREMGYRTVLGVPLLLKGAAIGAIGLRRIEAEPFTDKQIALLQTFADQAVIAIENVRLFNETKEALERQTATSEILGVISSSPTDVQPVFDAIVRNAVTLCGAAYGIIWRYDHGMVDIAGIHNIPPTQLQEMRSHFPRPIAGADLHPLLQSGNVINISDIEVDEGLPIASIVPRWRARGVRSVVVVPLRRDAEVVGAIGVSHQEVAGFSPARIQLLRTFADQAVIAIENVSLFKELQVRNHDLTESLERETATSEVLKVISRSAFDLQPVLDTLIENAARLCDARRGVILRREGDSYNGVSFYNASPELVDFIRRHPVTPGRHSVTGRVALERRTIHVADLQSDAEYRYARRDVDPIRTELGVPMFRGDDILGVIILYKVEVAPFTDQQIALVETFANQAVIAIENARLLSELQARTQELTRSVDQLTALGEVGRAVSSTLDLETVLSTIVSRAVELSGLDGGVVFEYDERAEEFMQRAAAETGGILAQARRGTRYRKGEGVVGRTAITLEPVQVPDISVPGAYVGRMRENLIESGIRALLAVPMVREGQLIGCLGVTRNQPGDFPAETIDLLRTFATQSALAIQNARLFHEIADKSRQLEVASQHKSEFLANMSHELRTPLNAILGFSEVLAQGMFGPVNDKQAEYLHDILESGRHLLSLINDILDLSKIEAGRMELELNEFDLPHAIQNALTLVRERALRRGIALHHVIDDRVAAIRADERKVKQVLLNLLSNAIKFTPEGGRIEVRAARADGLVEVSVTDSGIGIAAEDLETVFEEFRQVGTADKKAEGTGLGLALARKFIELHGGRIWVESELGRGSTFTFTLPMS